MNKEKLVSIGTYLLKGMTEREACILVDVPLEVFNAAKENDESIRKYLEKKIVEFKLKHIEQIQKEKSDKNSMYLLEKLRPDEFGGKQKNAPPSLDTVSIIIKSIQNDPNASLIQISNRGQREESQRQDDSARIIEGAALLN